MLLGCICLIALYCVNEVLIIQFIQFGRTDEKWSLTTVIPWRWWAKRSTRRVSDLFQGQCRHYIIIRWLVVHALVTISLRYPLILDKSRFVGWFRVRIIIVINQLIKQCDYLITQMLWLLSCQLWECAYIVRSLPLN